MDEQKILHLIFNIKKMNEAKCHRAKNLSTLLELKKWSIYMK